ncbi:MAG: mechanosensitive ion channel family protein [Candidatus Omnitrophica bacterium]|nr:mechanosensitive ion channel family protein [Candidatus Omnitrophota bacterium]
MSDMTLFSISIPAWLYAPVVFFLWVSLFLVLKKIFFAWIYKMTQGTATRLDDLIVSALNLPLTLLIFASGAVVLERFFRFEVTDGIATYFLVGLRATAIVAVILFLDRFLRGVMKEYATRFEIMKTSGGIIRGIVRAVVIGLGFLILLDTFGLSITPIVASLGIGSLAVALALQPTLENVFAGIQLVTDRMVQIGHFVKLDSGEEGYVDRIGWRSTWVRMLPNYMVIVPNKVLVNSKVLNYHYPDREIAVLVQVGVSYDSDLSKVETVTIEVAQEVMKTVPGAVAEFAPFIRYHTFNESSIDFTVIMRAKEFTDQYLIKHEFIRRLHVRYKKEGIVIPFPLRTLELARGTVEELSKLALRIDK